MATTSTEVVAVVDPSRGAGTLLQGMLVVGAPPYTPYDNDPSEHGPTFPVSPAGYAI